MPFNPSIEDFKRVMSAKGHAFFENDTKNYNLNLIGVRTKENVPNVFNDWMYVLWKFNGNWNLWRFVITTDPGIYWLQNPAAALGTAIVKEGQYRGLWQLGLHQGKYRALTQKANVTVIRDFDRDAELDYTSGREEKGMFGINCHRANEARKSIQVDKWSAGCQVFADPNDFKVFLTICEQAATNHGNSFTYTLLHERDFA